MTTETTEPKAERPKTVAKDEMTVEMFLSDARIVKEQSRYAQAAFKIWIAKELPKTVGARQTLAQWEELFKRYLKAPVK